MLISCTNLLAPRAMGMSPDLTVKELFKFGDTYFCGEVIWRIKLILNQKPLGPSSQTETPFFVSLHFGSSRNQNHQDITTAYVLGRVCTCTGVSMCSLYLDGYACECVGGCMHVSVCVYTYIGVSVYSLTDSIT